jgi:phosphopantothenoylcysteine decarboxylase/phosphopantothenate--cysteine ligase
VGFAAETQDIENYARDKLSRQGLDMIAANRVGKPGAGFGGDDNEILLLIRERTKDGEAPVSARRLGPGSKRALAVGIIGEIADQLGGITDLESGTDQSTRPASGH